MLSVTIFFGFQGKPPPTSFCDPDPGDLSNNSEKTVTKSTSNQYTEGRFFYLFYDYYLSPSWCLYYFKS